MRLIDADALKEKLKGTDRYFQIKFDIDEAPTVDVLNKIRAEIKQIADEEQKHDEKWAIGLRYAVKIIDKYREGEQK